MACEKFSKFLQFSIFGSSELHLTSILWPKLLISDWHIHQSQTHLPLLIDKEKFLLKLLGKNGSFSNDYLHSFQVLMESCISFRAKQQGNFFHIVGSHYQQASMQLLSAFRHRRQRLCSSRACFWNCRWLRSLHLAEWWFWDWDHVLCLAWLHAPNYISRPQCIFQLKFYLDMSYVQWQLNG